MASSSLCSDADGGGVSAGLVGALAEPPRPAAAGGISTLVTSPPKSTGMLRSGSVNAETSVPLASASARARRAAATAVDGSRGGSSRSITPS